MIFAYDYRIDDLENGLRLVTVPTDYPNIVAFYIVVQTGSRNEIEEGKSGFAHLFEHLMFRGTEKYSTEKYDEIMKLAGADRNAYTTDDRTVYHVTFSKEDIETIFELESDRFQRLRVPVDLFKTETKAVLGEYNKNASNPVNKIIESLRDTAFDAHTYKHTTMGFLRDVENMPSMYDYSLEFFNRYYRPEYTTLIVVGDVEREKILSLTNKYWGEWQRGNYRPEIPSEPEQTEERSAHIEWPAETLPWAVVAYKGPAYSDERKDMAAMDLAGSLGFSENSPLYQQLVIREQKVDALFYSFEDHLDPYLLIVAARFKDAKDISYVKDRIIDTFDGFKTLAPDAEKLDAVKSHLKYGFALSLDNSDAIAAAMASYIGLRRTPETINRLFEVYGRVTLQDIQEMSARYFDSHHRIVVTLDHNSR
ncbi:MAG: pitrilysin family protein [Acidobacteriota bacterium]